MVVNSTPFIRTMKTFKDLEFRIAPAFESKRAIMRFSNDYGISVIGGALMYGDGINTFEAAILIFDDENYEDIGSWPVSKFELTYNTPIADDVIGYASKRKITEIMKKIQQLESPVNKKCTKIFEDINQSKNI